MMTTYHPIIVTFDQTVAAGFPLVLFIGREPNADAPVRNCLGRYDFRWAPRCGFWNTAYGTVARMVGTNTYSLKQQCIQRRGSPIIFADALPHGLLNHVGDKHAHREAIPPAEIRTHISNMFSQQTIMRRVRLVLLCGLGNRVFGPACEAIEQGCQTEDIPLLHVPFLYGTNSGKIQSALTENHRLIIQDVMDRFTVIH
jgi:hypothetical protein